MTPRVQFSFRKYKNADLTGYRCFIEYIDTILRWFKVSPIIWTIIDDGPEFIYRAHIPADCKPELYQAADYISLNMESLRARCNLRLATKEPQQKQ